MSQSPDSNVKRSLFDQASPKLTFWFGFFVGAGLMTLIGFVFLMIVMLKGVDLSSAKTSTKTTTTNTNTTATTPTPTTATTIDASKITIDETDYIRGNKDAEVTLAVFGDLECPYCKRFHPELLTVLEANPDDVRIVYKHFPLSFHPEAKPGAVAAECAGKLGGTDAFWGFVDAVYDDQSNIGDAQYKQVAADLGLDADDFAACQASNEFDAKIAADQALGQSIGVGGTPSTYVIAGDTATKLSGAVPQAEVNAAVTAALGK